MEEKPNQDQIGGTSVHVADCYIWATIHYLDSCTDYRECLPKKTRNAPSPEDDKLVMLDDVHRPHGVSGLAILVFVCALLTFTVSRACGW